MGLGHGPSRRVVGSMQRLMRLLAISLDGTGTASVSEGKFDVSLTDQGDGDYLLEFNEPFKRVPVIVASPLTADVIVQIGAKSASSVQILAFDATDGTTAKDADIDILIIGADSQDQI